MTETQQRFLRAIAERVPVHQVVELHLFPPIRQGGVETGVAVVAEDPRRPLPNADAIASDVVAIVPAATLEAAGEAVTSDAPLTDAVADVISDEPPVEPEKESDGVIVAEADEESPYADDEMGGDEIGGDEIGDEVPDMGEPADEAPAESNGHRAPTPVSRFTIHTARYRLTLKGVDRGKWEVDVVAEAEAPLEAVDAVVRGVQRRAGEGTEPDRLNAEAFRGALEAPLATLER